MSQLFLYQDDVPSDISPIPIHICRPDGLEAVLSDLTPAQRAFAKAREFKGESGQKVQLPDESGEISCVMFGAGADKQDWLSATRTGSLSASLPDKLYHIASLPEDWDANLAAIGWGLGAYKFDKYLKDQKTFPKLVLEPSQNLEEITEVTDAVHMGRDLINTPAGDMGPTSLEMAATATAEKYGAEVRVTVGDDLLTQNYPMIHAVGRASSDRPRLVQFTWGREDNPKLALVGKGITFDTGGLNIKGASGARLMKKDMGGAAHALALAKMIMANRLPVRLHVLLAIAENAISGNAFRPGDILPSRADITVEIDNTDAEGRLVLGDALKRATEDEPDLIIDFATLTGAARVALGPTIPPFFCNRDELVKDIVDLSMRQADPVWHMPLWQAYHSMLSSPIADMKNSGGGFAGCMTAALFLERFVGDNAWMHFDVYGWNPAGGPAHPKGGEMFALRTLYEWVKSGGVYKLASGGSGGSV